MSGAKKLHKKGAHALCAEVENKEARGRNKDCKGARGNLRADVYQGFPKILQEYSAAYYKASFCFCISSNKGFSVIDTLKREMKM